MLLVFYKSERKQREGDNVEKRPVVPKLSLPLGPNAQKYKESRALKKGGDYSNSHVKVNKTTSARVNPATEGKNVWHAKKTLKSLSARNVPR